MPEHVWYFAYGANMSSATLRRRGVPFVEALPARLPEHRLSFDLRGLAWVEPSFANVVPDPEAEVHGVLYRMTPRALARLNRSESGAYKVVEKPVLGADGRQVSAWVYVNRRPRPPRPPSRRYLGLLQDGAREHGLPEPYQRWLAEQPSHYLLGVSDAFTLLVRLSDLRLLVALLLLLLALLAFQVF